jgi:hypothetical protein
MILLLHLEQYHENALQIELYKQKLDEAWQHILH